MSYLIIRKEKNGFAFISDGIKNTTIPLSIIDKIDEMFKSIVQESVYWNRMDYAEFNGKRYRIIMNIDQSIKRGLEWRFYKHLKICDCIDFLELDCSITITDKSSIRRLIKYLEAVRDKDIACKYCKDTRKMPVYGTVEVWYGQCPNVYQGDIDCPHCN